MENSSDRKLIADYLKGDEKSLEILIGRYLRPVYGFICRWVGNPRDAEDITQEVFVKAWRNLKRPVLGFSRGFDPRKGNFRTWIFGIARNASIDFLRKTRSASGGKKEIPLSEFSDPEGGNAVADTIADPGPLPSEFFERVDASRVLAAALEKLSP
jgi:RNA polymerase sigma-70 factor (ECF subfamily)